MGPKSAAGALPISFLLPIPLSLSLSFFSLGSIDSFDKKLWRKWANVRQQRRKKGYERHFRNCWQNMQLCKFVSMYVCVWGSLLYFIEIDILGSKCIGAEHITFIICCSCLAVSFSSASFFFFLFNPRCH